MNYKYRIKNYKRIILFLHVAIIIIFACGNYACGFHKLHVVFNPKIFSLNIFKIKQIYNIMFDSLSLTIQNIKILQI
jgi:hypothetical protein